MFMLRKTHERIVARLEMALRNAARSLTAAQNIIRGLEKQADKYRSDAMKYRAQRDAANKRKWDARKAAKVAK